MDSIVIRALQDAMDHNEEVALVTVINKTGSGPRDRGSMMLVDREGQLIAGTIGGGGVEERAKLDAVKCIESKLSSAFSYELSLKESEHSLGMACGGAVEIFIKVFSVKKPLYIFGAGHIGMVLCQMAKLLDYHVVVLDEREDYPTETRFLDADMLISGEMEAMLEDLNFESNANIVIVTHGHTHDLDVLRHVVQFDVAYVGMIGSKNKINHCMQTLLQEGVEEHVLKSVHAPIGLDIGGETPAEIALSILAEIQAKQFKKNGPFMKSIKGF